MAEGQLHWENRILASVESLDIKYWILGLEIGRDSRSYSWFEYTGCVSLSLSGFPSLLIPHKS